MDLLLNNDNNNLHEIVEEFFVKNKQIISKLESIVIQIKRHKTGSNVAKTVGTSVSGVGSVAMASALILTPFTGGLSSAAFLGGAVATAVGTVTNVGTDLATSVINNKLFNEIKQLAQQRNKCAADLAQEFAEMSPILGLNINKKLNRNIVDDEPYQMINIFKLLANGSLGLYKFGNNSTKLFEAIKEMKALKAAKDIESGSHLGTSLTKSVITLMPTEAKGLSSSLLRSTGPAVGKNVLKGASAVAGLAFTVLDVVTLVQDWNKVHPNIDVINNLIEELENDAKLVDSVYTVLTIDYSDQLLIQDIISAVQSDTNDNYLDNESEIDLNVNESRVSYKSFNNS